MLIQRLISKGRELQRGGIVFRFRNRGNDSVDQLELLFPRAVQPVDLLDDMVNVEVNHSGMYVFASFGCIGSVDDNLNKRSLLDDDAVYLMMYWTDVCEKERSRSISENQRYTPFIRNNLIYIITDWWGC